MIGGLIWLAVGLTAAPAGDESPPLSLSDMPDYRAALEAGRSGEEPAQPVGFLDLWEHPEAYRGRRVLVEGRILLRFHQEAVGSFPPLAEVWAFTPANNPFCLVFPDRAGAESPGLGGTVRFSGTFLKQVRYPGGDGDRLAPLIVGPNPPIALSAAHPSQDASPDLPRLDWLLGLIAAGLVVLLLLQQYLRRPPPRRRALGTERTPEFLTANPAEEETDGDP